MTSVDDQAFVKGSGILMEMPCLSLYIKSGSRSCSPRQRSLSWGCGFNGKLELWPLFFLRILLPRLKNIVHVQLVSMIKVTLEQNWKRDVEWVSLETLNVCMCVYLCERRLQFFQKQKQTKQLKAVMGTGLTSVTSSSLSFTHTDKHSSSSPC